MPVEIIQVGQHNSALLDNVADDVFDAAIDPHRVAAYVTAPHHVMLVAVHDGVVIGQILAAVHLHPDKPAELYIDDLAVAPEFQRQGTAGRLVEAVIGLGRRHGCETIWVAAEPDNAPANALYRSLDLTPRRALLFEGMIEKG